MIMGATSPKILIAEDSFVNQKILLRILMKFGCTADVVSNGLQVLEAVAFKKYDMIFMDMHMPEMDGIEATRKIVNSGFPGNRPKIIALTADSIYDDKKKCIEAGMDDYITKPVRIEEILSILNRWAPVPVMLVETVISQMNTVRKQYIPQTAPVFSVCRN
jgi:CheY-like chemotaxis protein